MRCHDDAAASTFEPWQQLWESWASHGPERRHSGPTSRNARRRRRRWKRSSPRGLCHPTARGLMGSSTTVARGRDQGLAMSSTGAGSHGPTGHRPAGPSCDRGSIAVRRQSGRAVWTIPTHRCRWPRWQAAPHPEVGRLGRSWAGSQGPTGPAVEHPGERSGTAVVAGKPASPVVGPDGPVV